MGMAEKTPVAASSSASEPTTNSKNNNKKALFKRSDTPVPLSPSQQAMKMNMKARREVHERAHGYLPQLNTTGISGLNLNDDEEFVEFGNISSIAPESSEVNDKSRSLNNLINIPLTLPESFEGNTNTNMSHGVNEADFQDISAVIDVRGKSVADVVRGLEQLETSLMDPEANLQHDQHEVDNDVDVNVMPHQEAQLEDLDDKKTSVMVRGTRGGESYRSVNDDLYTSLENAAEIRRSASASAETQTQTNNNVVRRGGVDVTTSMTSAQVDLDAIVIERKQKAADDRAAWKVSMGNVYRGVPVGPLGKKDLKPLWKEQMKYADANGDNDKVRGHVEDAVRRFLKANPPGISSGNANYYRASVASARTDRTWQTQREQDIFGFERDVELAMEQLRTYSERLTQFDVRP